MAELSGRWICDRWVPLRWVVPPLRLYCVSCARIHAVSGFGWRVTVPGALAFPCQEGPRLALPDLGPSGARPVSAAEKWCPGCQVSHLRTAFGRSAIYCRSSMNARQRRRTAYLRSVGLTARGRTPIYRPRRATAART